MCFDSKWIQAIVVISSTVLMYVFVSSFVFTYEFISKYLENKNDPRGLIRSERIKELILDTAELHHKIKLKISKERSTNSGDVTLKMAVDQFEYECRAIGKESFYIVERAYRDADRSLKNDGQIGVSVGNNPCMMLIDFKKYINDKPIGSK